MIIYVLKLEGGKFYVGKTNDLDRRWLEHNGNTFGSVWTKIYNPKEIVENVQDTGFSELATTLRYMKKYGVNNVRGADYCSVNLTKEQLKEISNHFCADEGNCYSCEGNHYTSDCPKKSRYFSSLSWFSWFSLLSYYWFYLLSLCSRSRKKDADHVLQFGKYKGHTYSSVWNKYKNYCEWILAQQSTNARFSHFQKWLRERS